MKLADQMMAKLGKSRTDYGPGTGLGKLFRRSGVPETEELRRVLSLPRRDWEADAGEMASLLTEVFARPGGGQKLRPVQAAALKEIHDERGSVLAIRVSGGKTLITFLAPALFDDCRPLLLVPAKLRDETEVKWWQYQANWRLPKLRIESYTKLGIESQSEYLFNYKPTLIIADEGHRLKNPKAAVTRRVERYLEAYPETVVVILSGTIISRSLQEFWHLLKWTHGPEKMPIPANWSEMMLWSECVDVHAKALKTGPGALEVLCSESERATIRFGGDAAIQATRQGFRRRLTETPGIVSTVDDKGVNCSLVIRFHDVPGLDAVSDTFGDMRLSWETPDGHPFEMASQLWQHARELACGFYYVWDPRPPTEWLKARKMWSRFVRGVLKHSHVYDTPAQVHTAVRLGELDDRVEEYDPVQNKVIEYRALERWLKVKDTFKPRTVAKWVSDATLDFAADWMRKRRAGVVWTEHEGFAQKLAARTGKPYYGAEGLDKKTGSRVLDERGVCIASVHANREGRNLQHWNEALVVSEIPNGGFAEQLLGRLHRDGQEADEVVYDWLLPSVEHWAGFHKILRDAQMAQDLLGQPQKVLLADLVGLPTPEEIALRRGGRWEKPADEDG